MNIKERYNINKKAKVGEICICPSCGTSFKKTNYQQVFCKTKIGTICKDKYWNTVTSNKRNNKTRISPANANWMIKQKSLIRYTVENYRIIDGVAYDEFDDLIYNIDIYEDNFEHGQWND
jgi:hypothetical protein